jgi:hypothetical protein
MEEKINKIVELDIDLENLELDDMGVDVVSLVTEPAIEVDFLAFAKEEEDHSDLEFSYNDYPNSVKNNAKRGIELNEKVDNKCATQVGKVRAQQLAQGENISLETIKRMYSYLSRAETYYDESDTEACGTISYLLWGGKSAKSWAESKLKELDEFENIEHEQFAVLDWAEETGEEITEEYMFISEDFNFESATAVQQGVRALGILSRMGIKKDQPAEIKYKYAGPTAERGFCRGMLSLNKMYGDEDFAKIESKLGTLNPRMGEGASNYYDVFKYKGGVSCRHYWSKVAVFRTDSGTIVIDKGPADGDAGKSNNRKVPGPRGAVSNNASTKYPGSFSFSVLSDEKRLVAGPLMIPNQMILRRTPDGDPYYVYFTGDTIRRIQERFNKELKVNNTDTQHDGNVHTDNVLLEQWIIESKVHDKSKFYGFENLPLNTWFGVYKINNDSDWERVKSGELRGFSVAGSFLEKSKEVAKEDEQTLKEIIDILKEIK